MTRVPVRPSQVAPIKLSNGLSVQIIPLRHSVHFEWTDNTGRTATVTLTPDEAKSFGAELIAIGNGSA